MLNQILDLEKSAAQLTAQRQAVMKDERLTDKGRQESIAKIATAENDVRARRDAMLEELKAEAERHDREHAEAQAAGEIRPRNAAEWQEAHYRRAFLQEDLGAMVNERGAIESLFDNATRAGDTVAAYIIKRDAPKVLESGNARERAKSLKHRIAEYERGKMDAKKIESLKGKRAANFELRQRLLNIKTHGDTEDIKIRFGLK